FGTGVVNKIYKEMIQYSDPAPLEEARREAPPNMNVLTRFAKTLSDIFVPIIPAIVASGLL
ncbi:PTS sucrose transporter subunit IIBC, partial [Bacillus paralicheniformis]|nr:PTS sucrose transporter subunit IIBC [Bacillus paralicheniformis]